MKKCIHKIPTNSVDDLYGILEFKNKNKLQESVSVYECNKCGTHFFSSPYKLYESTFSGEWKNIHVAPIYETDKVVLITLEGVELIKANYGVEDKARKQNIKEVIPKVSKSTEWYEKTYNKPFMKEYSTNWILYGLQLADNCYYIGRTQDFARRMEEHFTGKGAAFTRKHKPYRILFATDLNTTNGQIANMYENDRTTEFICVYGYEKVRGGDYCEENLRIKPKERVESIWTRECGKNIRVRIRKKVKRRCDICVNEEMLIRTYIYYKRPDRNRYNAMEAWFCPYCEIYYVSKSIYNDFMFADQMNIVNSEGKVITYKGDLCKWLNDTKCGCSKIENYSRECLGYCECPEFKRI